MKESPILMQGWKVLQILEWDWREGNMQTRRVIDLKDTENPGDWKAFGQAVDGSYIFWENDLLAPKTPELYSGGGYTCRYGGTGDLLWVKETFTYGETGFVYKTKFPKDQEHPKWKSSLYMPKEAARVWLEVVKVGVERVQDITKDDCIAEGVHGYTFARGVLNQTKTDARWKFIDIWNDINDKRGYGWNANPFVWVIAFKLHAVLPLSHEK